MTALNTYITNLSDHGFSMFMRAVRAFSWVMGAAIALLIIYQIDTKAVPAITDYRVTKASLSGDVLTISGQMTLARNCRMNYINFYGENNVGDVTKSLAHYEREQVMRLTQTIDHGAGQTAFGPITVPVPGAGKFDWISIVASHACHPVWPHVTHLVKLYVPTLKEQR